MDRQCDIEHVVPELRPGRETQISPHASRLDQWLTTVTTPTGSDLLVIPGAPACIRFEGEVRAIAHTDSHQEWRSHSGRAGVRQPSRRPQQPFEKLNDG